MGRVRRVCIFSGFVHWASCLAISCAIGAHVAACSSEDSTDTGVSRTSDDDADRRDDNADQGNDTEEPNTEFTISDYYRAMCDYYTRCSTAIRGLYGDKDQCVAYYLDLINAYATPADEQEWQAYWNTACLRQLASVECPSTPVLDREPIEVYLSLYREVLTCVDADELPCRDDDSCLTGRCSARADECGICEPLPQGECRSSYECATGEVCLDDECALPKATGSECESAEQCASGHCTDSTCVVAIPEGGACETTLDCGSYLWCHDGKCARPGAAAAACDVDIPLSCQIGHACYEGTCQAVSYTDVPIGGLCASTASCVAGARCSIESICEATGNECATDSHCGEDQYCEQTCLPQLELDAACESSSHCKSGYCSDAAICAERNTCE